MQWKHCLAWNGATLFLALSLAVEVLPEAPADASFGKPDTLIVAADLSPRRRDALLEAARGFYSFWNTGDPKTLKRVISPAFIDRDLPEGRPQGPGGPLFAIRHFRAAVSDLHCEVLQQIIAGDRVASHLRFTGHFNGSFGNLKGAGAPVDFVAIDILRVDRNGQIADNWHLEDNLTFLKEIGAVKH